MWVLPVVELKRDVPYTGVFCVIISKFYHRVEPCLVILFIIKKSFKVNFYCIILLLSLVGSLRIEESKEPLFHAHEVAQGGPELEREY